MNPLENSCRVCSNSIYGQDVEFESLFDDENCKLSAQGELYEDLFGLKIEQITKDYYPRYLCSSCELQMKLFKQLKTKAIKTLWKLQYCDAVDETATETFANVEYLIEAHNEKAPIVYDIKSAPNVNSETKKELEPIVYNDNDEEHTLYGELNIIKILETSDATSIEEEILDEPTAVEFEDCKQTDIVEQTKEKQLTTQLTNNNENNCFDSDDNESFLMIMHVDYLDETLEQEEATHEDSDMNHLLFVCRSCGERFEKRRELSIHRRTKHDGKYPCPQCAKQLLTSYALTKHLKVHEQQFDFKCDLCGKVFTQKVHYQYHMNNHNNVRKFKCSQCDKRFIANADLNVHMRTHSGERERRFACVICGKKFFQMQHLRMHHYSHQDKNFHCELCQKSFVSPSTLRLHMTTVHAAQPKHQCELCCRKFRRRHHLMMHYKVHRDKNSYDPPEMACVADVPNDEESSYSNLFRN